jgi:hypothetical protein
MKGVRHLRWLYREGNSLLLQEGKEDGGYNNNNNNNNKLQMG